jgi:hypothetical protein
MTYFFCMHRADFEAGAVPPRLTKYFSAKIDKKLLWAFAFTFGTDLLAAPAVTPPSQQTVHSCQLG